MNPIIEELRREARFILAPQHVVQLLLRAAEAIDAAEARANHLESMVGRLTAERTTEAQAVIDQLIARVEQAEHDRNDLAAWKESALQSLNDWHALGEALMEFAPLTIGDNIQQTLAAEIPRLLRRS